MSTLVTLKFVLPRSKSVPGKDQYLILQFQPFESEDYNWVISNGNVETKVKLGFNATVCIFLMSPRSWFCATIALRNEKYIVGAHLPLVPARQAFQMYLTWFGLPKTREELTKFTPNTWQKKIIDTCGHFYQEGLKICVRCGLVSTEEVQSSDEEEEDSKELCVCGREFHKCKCVLCSICNQREEDCTCTICLHCDKCRCPPKGPHRKLHPKDFCACSFCQICDCVECECDESSDDILIG